MTTPGGPRLTTIRTVCIPKNQLQGHAGQESDQRRGFANTMNGKQQRARHRHHEVSIDLPGAGDTYQVEMYVGFPLKTVPGGDSEPRDRAPPRPQKERPKQRTRQGNLFKKGGGGKNNDANLQAGNTGGCLGRTHRKTRMGGSTGSGVGKDEQDPNFYGGVLLISSLVQ